MNLKSGDLGRSRKCKFVHVLVYLGTSTYARMSVSPWQEAGNFVQAEITNATTGYLSSDFMCTLYTVLGWKEELFLLSLPLSLFLSTFLSACRFFKIRFDLVKFLPFIFTTKKRSTGTNDSSPLIHVRLRSPL